MDFLLHFGPSEYLSLFRSEHPYFSREGKGDIRAFADKYQSYYEDTRGKGLICIPSGNHDMPRLGGKLDQEEIKLVFAFLMAMPGAPFVYYGDEIGMRYLPDLVSVEGGFDRTGTRTPMQWDKTVNAGFSAAPKEKLYIPLDPDENRPHVSEQMSRENSLWREVQRLIALRLAHPALWSDASYRCLYAEKNQYPFVFLREQGEEKILVALNPCGLEVSCRVELPRWKEILYFVKGEALYRDGVLTMPGASAVFVKV